MKKLLILLCAGAFLAPGAIFAQSKKAPEKKKPVLKAADESMSGQGYGMAGCGLGSIALGDQKGIVQIFAATLNGTAGNQTFGITSGTSNCKTDEDAKKSASLFIVVNREVLAKDISRGSGESLDTLSELVGCRDSRLLGGKLQQNYKAIFPSQTSSSEDAGRVIFDLIKNDAALAANCAQVG
jgi:hypothetical protein